MYSGSQHSYKTIKTGEAFLQVRSSEVVGLAGLSTGDGVFTLKKIPANAWLTSYAPLAPIRVGQQHSSSDYIIKTTTKNGTEVEIDGALCPLGIGKKIQDGSFPFCLVPEKYSALIKWRVNCEIADRDGEIWLRSTRDIAAKEELLTKYSHDNSYWYLQFSKAQLREIRQALLSSTTNSLQEAEAIMRTYKMR